MPKTLKTRRNEITVCGNGGSVEVSKERARTQKQCGKAPAAITGGKRRRFPAEPKPGSLVRIIKERCNASLQFDVVGEDGNTKVEKEILYDTGTQAGCCGTLFVNRNGLDIHENCNTKLVDASGNKMTVVGSTCVGMFTPKPTATRSGS